MGGAAAGQGEQQCVVGLCVGGRLLEGSGLGLGLLPAQGTSQWAAVRGNDVPCLKKGPHQ